MSEQQRILEMIEKGQITAAEGMELLEALKLDKEQETSKDTGLVHITSVHNYKYFKIKVSSDHNTVNVNVNIPIRLLTTLGEIASKMTAVIPADARREMENKGIDISGIDFGKIIEEIIHGTLDEPSIVDVEVWDEEHKDTVRVKIYVE